MSHRSLFSKTLVPFLFFLIKKKGIPPHTYTLLLPTKCCSNHLINMVNQCSPFSQALLNEDYGLIENVLAIQL